MISPLPERRLGELSVSAIGFGAMVLSPGMYGPVDDEVAMRALTAAFDAGSTFVDTSDGYGPDGHNERLVGQAIRGRREEIIVATKFGFRVPAGVDRHAFPVGFSFGELSVNAHPDLVPGYLRQSLVELGTDYVDLYYPHFPDPQVPIEETIGAVADQVAAGTVRFIGLSNVSAEQLARAHRVHPISAVQTEWSMWRPIDTALLSTARELGVGIVAWAPLGGGFLTGTVDSVGTGDFRQYMPRYAPENLAHNIDRYASIREMAGLLGTTPGQLALAWLLHQDPAVVPIPGSRNPLHIRENLEAARLQLPSDAIRRVEQAVSAFRPEGKSML